MTSTCAVPLELANLESTHIGRAGPAFLSAGEDLLQAIDSVRQQLGSLEEEGRRRGRHSFDGVVRAAHQFASVGGTVVPVLDSDIEANGERRIALLSTDVLIPVCNDGLGPSQIAAMVFAGIKRRANASMEPERWEYGGPLGEWCARPSALPHGALGGFDPVRPGGVRSWDPVTAPHPDEAIAQNFAKLFGRPLLDRLASKARPSFYEDFHGLMDPEFSGLGATRVENRRSQERDWFSENVYNVRARRTAGELKNDARVFFVCFEASAAVVMQRLCEVAASLDEGQLAAHQTSREQWHSNVYVIVVAAAKCQVATTAIGRTAASSREAMKLAYISIASLFCPALAANAPMGWEGSRSQETYQEQERARAEEARLAQASLDRRPLVVNYISVVDTLARGGRADKYKYSYAEQDADEMNRQIEDFVAKSVARTSGYAVEPEANAVVDAEMNAEVEKFVAKTLERIRGSKTQASLTDSLAARRVEEEARQRLDEYVKKEVQRAMPAPPIQAHRTDVAPAFDIKAQISTEHAGAISALAVLATSEWGSLVARDGFAIATAGGGHDDFDIKIWSLHPGKLLATLEGHTHWVTSLLWLPERSVLVSGSRDGFLRLWKVPISMHDFGASGALDYSRISCLQVVDVGGTDTWGVVRMCHCSCNTRSGSLVAGAFTNDTIRVWDLEHHGMEMGRDMTGHRGEVTALIYVESTTGRQHLVSGGSDATLRIWSIEEACTERSSINIRESFRADAPIRSTSSVECPACKTMNHPSAKKCMVCTCLLKKVSARTRLDREERARNKRLTLFGGLSSKDRGANVLGAELNEEVHAQQTRYTNGLVRTIQFYDVVDEFNEKRRVFPSLGSGETNWFESETHPGKHCGSVLSLTPQGDTFWAGFSGGAVKQFNVQTGDCITTLPHENKSRIGPMGMLHLITAPILVRCSEDGKVRMFDLVTERCFQTIDANQRARQWPEWKNLAAARGHDYDAVDVSSNLKFASDTVFSRRSAAQKLIDEESSMRKKERVSLCMEQLAEAIGERGKVLRSINTALDEMGWALLLVDHTAIDRHSHIAPPVRLPEFVGRMGAYCGRALPQLRMTDEGIRAMFETMDVDQNSSLNAEEILCGLTTLAGLDSETAATRMFDAVDAMLEGKLPLKSFVVAFRAAIAMGALLKPKAHSDPMTGPNVIGDGMAHQLFSDCGKSTDAKVTKDEFMKWFMRNMGPGKQKHRMRGDGDGSDAAELKSLCTVNSALNCYVVFGSDNVLQIWSRPKSDETVPEDEQEQRRQWPAWAKADPYKYAELAMHAREK